ncbi:MAG: nucleotidyltransferase family protein [Anaerolineae bacterium]|nr:nucleotidyltransferase family protein [Anaerolineae bacterium]
MAEDRYMRIARTLGQRASAEKVLNALAAEGIPVIVFKGLTLRERVYDTPHQRMMHDLDFLVRQADFEKAAHIIQSLGYAFTPGDKEYTFEFARRYMGEVQYRKGFVYIDLHWSLTAMGWYRLTTNFNLEQLWERAVPTKIGGAPACRLCTVDEIIHLCYHTAVHHGLAHGPSYRDIQGVLRVQGEGVDWLELAQCARNWRVSTAVWSALSVLRNQDAAVVPGVVLADFGVPKWRRALLKPIINRVQKREQMLTSGTMRFMAVLLVDRWRDLPAALLKGLFPGKQWLKTRFDLPDSQVIGKLVSYPFEVIWNGVRAVLTLPFG